LPHGHNSKAISRGRILFNSKTFLFRLDFCISCAVDCVRFAGCDAVGFCSSVGEPDIPRMLADIYPSTLFGGGSCLLGGRESSPQRTVLLAFPYFQSIPCLRKRKDFIRKTGKAETEYLGSDIICLERTYLFYSAYDVITYMSISFLRL
jgi:hypothetical protein